MPEIGMMPRVTPGIGMALRLTSEVWMRVLSVGDTCDDNGGDASGDWDKSNVGGKDMGDNGGDTDAPVWDNAQSNQECHQRQQHRKWG